MSDAENIENLTYEAAFAELESIVNALESNGRALEEAMKLYERGQGLAAHCAALLEKAELNVKRLNGSSLVSYEG